MHVADQQPVSFCSSGEAIVGTLFLPRSSAPTPALVISHGAGEFKENYFPLCEFLASKGLGALAIDMHGHGGSEGDRFCVDMEKWVSDVRAAVAFLAGHPAVDGQRLGALGLSSGGTAVLEAALVEPRLKVLIALDATVRNTLPLPLTCLFHAFSLIGGITKAMFGRHLRIPLARLPGAFRLAADPSVEQRLRSDPRALEAFLSFPFPGAAQAFFVDTIKRVTNITVPTLVLWGEEDQLDSPDTARLLFKTLSCKKRIHIVPGNGHVGHMDRNKETVFALTADWALENLP
jgi:alpha-beta hydrolase superfamily lysophospholipase